MEEKNHKMVLDVETTGLKADNGDRIVEIGIVEVIDNKKTGRIFHRYIKPVDEAGNQISVGETEKIHGLSNEFLADKPTMAEVIDEVINFISGSVLVIHNAKFDVKFLEKELASAEKDKLFHIVKNVHCTLLTDTRLYPKEKHKLDDMCDRLGVDRSSRTMHGALLDADLLADCFIITNEKFDTTKIEETMEQTNWKRDEVKRFDGVKLRRATLDSADNEQHSKFIEKMETKNKKPSVFSLGSQHTAKLGM